MRLFKDYEKGFCSLILLTIACGVFNDTIE